MIMRLNYKKHECDNVESTFYNLNVIYNKKQ